MSSLFTIMKKTRFILAISLLLILNFLTACSIQTDQPTSDGKLKVVATTTIVGDVVSQIGSDLLDLNILLPVGTDPHGFDPTPQDIAKVAEADIVFANGAGLEKFLNNLLGSAGAQDKVVEVSDGIDFLTLNEEEPGSEEQDHNHNGIDPHTWTDPNNVMIWVDNIEQALIEIDPENIAVYTENADIYKTELKLLDTWIRQQIAQIPAEKRKLVTDHALFGYYAEEYGFEQVGALVQGFSTLAEPTAQNLAEIEDAIHDLNVEAIFIGNTVNPSLGKRVTEDTGTQLVFVYTGSLSNPDGEANTYLAYMRYNTTAFVNALTPNP